MAHKKMKLRNKIWSLALCASMILSCLPISAFAEGQDNEYIHEHTTECGHNYGEEETTESTETTAPAYTAEDVKAMIDALPEVSELETMDSDELSEVYEKAQDAYAAFEALTEEQQAELAEELAKLRNVLEYMTGLTASTASGSGTKDGFSYNFRYGECKYCNGQHSVQGANLVSIDLNDGKVTLKFEVWFHNLGSCSKTAYAGTYDSSNSGYNFTYEITQPFSCTSSFWYSFSLVGDNTTKPELTSTSKITRSAGHNVSTWTSAGNGKHSGTCSLCKQTITENCSGGTATCQNKAVCSTCKNEYGSAADHNYILNAASLGNGQHKVNCEWCSAEKTEDCSFENGICSVCGYNQPAVKKEGYYEIGNLGQLMWFAQKINAQEITSHSAILTGDITIDNSVVWTPISLKDHCESTFDGNKHTITFANTKEGSTFGLFASYNYSTIQNLYLAGNITCNSANCVGVLVNSAYSTTIQNVISTCTVNNSGNGATGGLAGYFGGGSANIKNSAVYADVSCGDYAGGLIGNIWNGNQPIQSVTNCAYMGNVTGGAAAGALVGYNGNNSGKNSPFTNVYYYEKNGLGYLGKTKGGTITVTNVEAKTEVQFSSGEVAYLLNNGVTDGTQAWYQICQSDNYPNFSGKTVYKGYVCGSGNSDPVYRNSMDGILTVASPEHKYNDSGICENCGQTKSATWDETENVYKIYNIGQLRWFADYVNAGNTNINGKLMANIDASSLTSLAIGVSGKAYSGTFDGNGYTLTIGLNSTAQYAAPFQYVNGATIKNLIVKGSITTNQKFAASIVGQSTGTTKIENCLSYVTINSSVSGDGTHGGLVANVSSGTTTINNCGFVGSINGSNTNNCGGLVGWSNGTTNISNSFVAATFNASTSGSYTFSRGNNVTLTNCYYWNAFGTTRSGATQVKKAQITSGELAWLLNGSTDNGTWKQAIGTDDYPNFSGSAVYKTAPCESYSNAGATKEHDVEYGVCKSCNAVFQTIVPAIWNETKQAYEIYAASQLMWFAGLVNGTLDGVEQNQFANAILMNDIDMWSVTDYVPIGGTTGLYYSSEGNDKGYQGVFDGNGHVIKNLSVTGSDTDERTYGVFGTLSGTVKHLGVENFTFTLGSQDCRTGGIVGQMLSGSLIEDCYVVNSTITATGKVAGGIAGCNYAGTIQNCFTYKVTITATRSGGIVGDNRGDGGADDRKGMVSNCYTDATAIERQAGTVVNSTSGIGATKFASGQIGFLLNDGRDVWKQTFGTHDYPVFSGDSIKSFDISSSLISAKITWTAMEFTYDGGTWDAETHSYSGGAGTWTVAEGGGKITVENLGGETIYAKFSFDSNITGVSGNFSTESSEITAGGTVDSQLTLSGTPSTENTLIGMLSVKLTRNPIKLTWSVGDKVTWYGDDGKAYECYVLSKTTTGYVLVTTSYVYNASGWGDGYSGVFESMGARLPSPNTSESDYVKQKFLEKGFKGDYKYFRCSGDTFYSYIGSENFYFWSTKYTPVDKCTTYIWAVFDVPIS